jgi:putative tryptophan/tyrosine transport system substrate-binding protein
MRRREFIAGLGSAAACPVVARAQQTERMRLIGVLMLGSADDRKFQARLRSFLQGLALFGWMVGLRPIGRHRRLD